MRRAFLLILLVGCLDGILANNVNRLIDCELTLTLVSHRTLARSLSAGPPVVSGCTDPLACNYDNTATLDDGSCIYYSPISSIDTVALYPDSVVLTLPIGYDSYSWTDSWGAGERPAFIAGSYTLNMIANPTPVQAKELEMINLTPQTPYQGSWGNVAGTSGELLRTSSTGEWTFSAWVKTVPGDTEHSIIGRDLWWGNGYHIGIFNSELFSAFMSVENGHVVRRLGTIVSDTYQHVAVTHDGTVRRHFLNGVEVGSWTEPSTFNFSGGGVGIGYCASTFDCTFNGRLDELTVWHRAIPAAEMNDLMHCPYEMDTTGLVAFWDFEDAGGGAAADKSGNGHTLGWVNSPTIEVDTRSIQCLPTCESLTYNLTVLQPACHDTTACNFAGFVGYSQPDSCSYLSFTGTSVQPATGAGGLGSLYVTVAGGNAPYSVLELNSNQLLTTNSWIALLPGRLRLRATDAGGCATEEDLLLAIPYTKCD